MIKVVGKTNPFIIKLATDDSAFQIDNFYEIEDPENNNPICRIIKSENLSLESVKNIEKDIYGDIVAEFKSASNIYIATAKIENYIKKPIKSGANVIFPTFEKIKPFTVKPKVNDSFILGEINGTDVFMNTVPDEYKNLFMIRKNSNIVEQTSVPFLFDYKKMCEAPHIGLFGGSGSGKTFALKVIVEELMKKRIPNILFDPHMEMNFSNARTEIPSKYHQDFKNNFTIFTIGKNIGIDFSEISTEELITIMEFAGDMSGAMNNFMRELHEKGETFAYLIQKLKKLMNFYELYEQKTLKKESLSKDDLLLWNKYSSIIPGMSTLIAVNWRLTALYNEGVFNCDINSLKNALMQQKTCVIRGEMKALNIVGAYLISKLYYLRKNYIDGKEIGVQKESFFPFFISMDEAHIFCPKTDTKSPIKNILKTISQEGRKYGVFEIMATQRPSLLDETIVAQMSTKFIFKLSIKEDLLSVQKETDLSNEEIERLPYINSGECFISSSIFGKTLSISIRYNVTDVTSKSNPFDELNIVNEFQELLLTLLPINNINVSDKIRKIKEVTGKTYIISEIINELEDMANSGKISKEKSPLGNNYLM